MKIIVLGGAGDMGSQTVEDLAATPGVEKITIADKNADAAHALANRLSRAEARIDVRPVDAFSHDDLVAAIRGYDVAASALGPFYLFEPRLVRASIEVGVDYVSICDDWIAAQRVLDEYNALARQRNRIIVIGLGASPGLTNLAVRYLANQMDQPRKVTISIYQPPESGKGMAVLKHVLFIFSGKVPIQRNGRLTMVRAGSAARPVDLPRGGRLKAWNVGHAEPVTLPRFIPGLEDIIVLMTLGGWSRFFLLLGRLRLTTTPKRIDRIADLLARILPAPKPDAPEPDGVLRVDVEGIRGGKAVNLLLCGVGGMRPATGVTLSIGAQMMARRQILVKDGGVYGPEAVFDPLTVFKAMEERTGIRIYTDLAMTQPLVGGVV